MALGSYNQNISVVTVYDTLGPEGLTHALKECDISCLYTSFDLLGVVAKILNNVEQLKTVIYHGKVDEEKLLKYKKELSSINLLSFDELIDLGKKNPRAHVPPKKEDLACIMYTSGTTGNPKGVMITHENITASAAGILPVIRQLVDPGCTLISFLPMAHILAFAVDVTATYYGVIVGYATPRTLTDASVRNCVGDFRALKPDYVIGVPQIYDTIRKGVLTQVNKAGPVAQFVFHQVLALKKLLRSYNLPHNFLDFVFKKVREQTGGNLKVMVSGGAPLSKAAQEFMDNTICSTLQGYGLTETCGLSFVCTPEILEYGKVGQPSYANEFKLVAVSEMGYKPTNNPPQGELWIRGGAVSVGYYNNEKATKEAFTEDGWFMTGDIVELDEAGSMSIIDRKKNLVKLSNGEYIALEKCESIYRNSLIAQHICVFANSEKSKPIAVIHSPLSAVNNLLEQKGINKVNNLEGINDNKPALDAMLQDLLATGKKNGLKGTELVAQVVVTEEDWTSENGILTAAQKVKRKELENLYKSEIEAAFAKV
jgi:long-chain acyl-CoA synthetase